MRALIAASVTLIAVGVLAAEDKKYQSKDGKYAVGFAGEPKVESKSESGLTTNTAVVEGNGIAYWVISTPLPSDILKANKPEEILQNSENSLIKSFRGKVTETKVTTQGKDKYPARDVKAEVVVDSTTLHVRVILVLANGRMYQVLTIGTKDALSGAGADKFFESFEVTK